MALLIFMCIASKDYCAPVVIATGFAHQKQCESLGPLMIDGWRFRHPEATVERVICTPNPEYIIGAWQT